jgi:Mg2+-importing ATPase
VAAGGRKSIVMDILHRCKNPLVIQLLVMCALFYWTDDPGDASIVGAMVVLSVILSYVQETRSSRAVEKLQKMVKTTVTVVRDGKETDVQRRMCSSRRSSPETSWSWRPEASFRRTCASFRRRTSS